MGILLNEYDWTEKMINDCCLGDRPFETLHRVAKYYYENDYSKKETRNMIEKYLLQCNTGASINDWSELLDSCIRNLGKTPLNHLEGINIYRNEIEKIKGLKGTQLQRLAFTLLVLAKFYDLTRQGNNHWVWTPDSEIMKMANIGTSIERQSLLYNKLYDEGMIRFSRKVDNLNVQILFSEEDGDIEMFVHDLRNLGYQFLMYCGEPYFECANCGIVTKIAEPKKGRKPKYCSSCALEVKIRQNVNSVMRHRSNILH